MQYVCDAGELTWFRIETEAEAMTESQLMDHAVDKYFRKSYQQAVCSYVPPAELAVIEQKIGLKDHIRRTIPRFMRLRASDGTALVTAMLPPDGRTTMAMTAM